MERGRNPCEQRWALAEGPRVGLARTVPRAKDRGAGDMTLTPPEPSARLAQRGSPLALRAISPEPRKLV